MTTFVGMETAFADALKHLVELNYDTVEAYEASISRLQNPKFKENLLHFLSDHKDHIEELSDLLKKHGQEPPTGPDKTKQWIAKGKVVLANIAGDKAILEAMYSNEIDTCNAYERMTKRVDKWDDANDILQKGWEIEQKHKKWLEERKWL